MRNVFILVTFTISLAACGGDASVPRSSGDRATSDAPTSTWMLPVGTVGKNEGCGGVYFDFHEHGGRIDVPPPGDTNYGLTVRYAPLDLSYDIRANERYDVPGGLSSCPPNSSPPPPVPAGYTLDWFGGAIAASSVRFQAADLHGEITSNTWRAHTDYYLYAYDCNNFLYFSYKVGPLHRKGHNLSFASPFESPYGIGGICIATLLEIVHPTK